MTLLSGYRREYEINEKDTSIFLPFRSMIVYYCAKNSRRGFHEEQKIHEHVKENLMMVLKLKELFSQSKYLCLIFAFF